MSRSPSIQDRYTRRLQRRGVAHGGVRIRPVRPLVEGNFLGEWHTYEEAEEAYPEYIRADPNAVERLELWHEDERIHVDPEKISAVTAA